MLIALLSDVHANLPALQQVVQDMEQALPREYGGRTVERIWCLGDLIDRGPHPTETVVLFQALEQRYDVRYIAGNHEALFFGTERLEAVNEFVQQSSQLHQERLGEYKTWFKDRFTTLETDSETVGHNQWFSLDVGGRREIRALNMRAQDVQPQVHLFLTHAAWFVADEPFSAAYRFPYSFWRTRDPIRYERNIERIQKHITFLDDYARTHHVPALVFYGHSHFVGGAYSDAGGIARELPLLPKQKIPLSHRAYDINVGSVGHSRVGNLAQTRYFVLDTEALTLQYRTTFFNPNLLRNGLNTFYAGHGRVLDHMIKYFLEPEW
jgi:hypothetical protein